MGKLLIDKLPDDVLQKLQQEAQQSDREVADVAADHLTEALRQTPPANHLSKEELLQLADSIRIKSGDGKWLTPEFIRAAREEGRA